MYHRSKDTAGKKVTRRWVRFSFREDAELSVPIIIPRRELAQVQAPSIADGSSRVHRRVCK